MAFGPQAMQSYQVKSKGVKKPSKTAREDRISGYCYIVIALTHLCNDLYIVWANSHIPTHKFVGMNTAGGPYKNTCAITLNKGYAPLTSNTIYYSSIF